jgi:hypothetical protein
MTIYAHIIDNKISNIIVADQAFIDSLGSDDVYINITSLSPQPGIGWNYDGITFMPPEDTNHYLSVNIPKNPSHINTDITATVEIKDGKGNVVLFDGTYYVPVIRTTDNLQSNFLVFKFINGMASTTFQIKEPGIYTVQLDKISPKPSAILPSNIELIVI